MDFVMSYSGGKDSALALYRMIKSGHNPIAIMTTLNPEPERSWFHGIQKNLLDAVSASLNIPLLVCCCKPYEYTSKLEEALQNAKSMGAQACVFGDIDIADHKDWNEERCKTVGLECILPLWQQGREELTREFVDSGFKAVIKIVQTSVLDESFLGKTLSAPVIEELKKTKADVCGENGEYHTFVYDGPIFSNPVDIKLGEIIDFGTHKAVDILYN